MWADCTDILRATFYCTYREKVIPWWSFTMSKPGMVVIRMSSNQSKAHF